MGFQMISVIYLTIAIAVLALANNQPNLYDHYVDVSLLDFISRSSEALQHDPQKSVECFSYYIPLINKLAEDYENAYKECMATADTAITAADAATEPQRNQLGSSFENACAAVFSCQNETESLAEDIFECYVAAGTTSAKSLYNVSSVATLQLAELQEQIRRIKSTENICITNNKIQYEKDSGAAYEEFNKCILGETGVPPSTEDPPLEPSSSPEIPSSTEEPPTSPEAPLTTEEPPPSPETPDLTEDSFAIKMPEEDIYRFLKRFKHVKG